jgi:signal transduction histidine kinase
LSNGKKLKLIQIVDVSHHILYTEFKAKVEFTSLINACVSHELRNPLNSIMAKNIEKEALYKELTRLFSEFNPNTKESEPIVKCKEIVKKLEEGRIVQENSAKFMKFIV